MSDIKAKIEKLRQVINLHNFQYHVKQRPIIDDPSFDLLFAELKRLEDEHPEYFDPNSPTQKIGGYAENTFVEVKHKIPMLSLPKSMSWDEFEEWFKKMVQKNVKKYSFEGKMDGLATTLHYLDTFFNLAATRGDKDVGEDVTATALTVENLPKSISESAAHEVRGEIILLKSGLKVINDKLIAAGEEPYENVRNAASGILRTKNPDPEMGKYLKFAAYMLANSDKALNSHSESMAYIKSLGFTLTADLVPSLNIDLDDYLDLESALNVIKQYFKVIEDLRKSLDFDIDGIVCKADLYDDQKRLGSKTTTPNWATAFKFDPEKAITQIIGWEDLLGAKGNITPRSILTPVKLGGTTVKKPTLHNYDEIDRLDVRIGDYVEVARMGDVIPKIVRVLTDLRTGSETKIPRPTECPECHGPIIWKKGIPRCENADCTGGQISKILNYRNALEIEEFGPAVVEKLIEAGTISDLTDIYNLVVEDISGLEKMGEKSAKKIIANIEKSKKAPLWRVLAGLTIKMVGGETAKEMADKFKTLEGFSKATLVELVSIGDVVGNHTYTWLQNPKNQEILTKLINLGIGMDATTSIVVASSNKLAGTKFGFTGELPNYTRKEAEKLIVDNGGEVVGLKKETTHILIGDGAKQKKIDDTKKKNPSVIVIEEAEFLKMIG